MALIKRFLRLCLADLHGVLDRLEQPQIVLRQALREMEEELEHTQGAVKGLQQEISIGRRRRAELEQVLSETEGDLQRCLQADDDTQARALLRRKLESKKLLSLLLNQEQLRQATHEERRALLLEQQQQLQSVRQQAELLDHKSLLLPGSLPATAVGREQTLQQVSVGEEEIEIALLQARQQREQREQQAQQHEGASP